MNAPHQVRWLVQRPPAGDDSPTPGLLRQACDKLGLPFETIEVNAGCVSLRPAAGPVVVHGRKTLLHAALAHPVYRQAVFFDLQTFTPEASLRMWGPRMLNEDQRLASWGEVLESADSEVFVRPNNDDKLFTGRLFRPRELMCLFDALAARGLAAPTDRIVVAPVQEIDAEARLFVVDRDIVGGSYYRPNSSPHLPRDLLGFAEEAIQLWGPAPIFTLDIARAQGEYRILETNCFNGSRFYGADVVSIVDRVSDFQLAHWR